MSIKMSPQVFHNLYIKKLHLDIFFLVLSDLVVHFGEHRGLWLFQTLAVVRQMGYKVYFGVLKIVSFREYYMASQHKHF